MDPYDILGLTYPATKEEIKARYYELARKHHPDKLQHLSQEERDRNEQEFKKINVAYELLTKKEFEYTTKGEWKGMWSSVDSFFSDPDMLRNMGELLKNVVNATREYRKQRATEHHIEVEVTLEEIYLRKEKKLRLFLKKVEEPVFITIDCGCFPSFMVTHFTPDGRTMFININYKAAPHPVYSHDTMFDTNSLFTNLSLTLSEYFSGCTKTLPYLDGTTITVTVPACSTHPIELPGRGLTTAGILTIYPKVELPTKNQLDSFPEKKLAKLHTYLKKLDRPPQNGVKMI